MIIINIIVIINIIKIAVCMKLAYNELLKNTYFKIKTYSDIISNRYTRSIKWYYDWFYW
jgi:hypothetical protein